jgi:hypothetical protein
MTGLAKSEAQANHRQTFHAARESLGRRPAFVADHAACLDTPIIDIGVMLGYRSLAHGRVEAYRILSDAGYRLSRFWKELDR